MKIAKETINTMMKQITLDCNLNEAREIAPNMFLSPSKKIEGARIIENMDLFMKVIVFMGKAYVMADESILGGCEDLFKSIPAEWLFEFHNLRKIDYILGEYGREIVDTHIYFLPADGVEKEIERPNDIWLYEKEIEAMRENNPFHHAFCYSTTQPDIIGVASMEGDKIKAVAGASEDGKYVRQIGIDVLNEYRGQGLATHLVSLLRQRILEDGSLPFYGTNESHALSRNVAIQSGFLPAYSEFFVTKMKKDKHNKTRH